MRSGPGASARSPRWSTFTRRSWKVGNLLAFRVAEGVTGRSQVPARAMVAGPDRGAPPLSDNCLGAASYEASLLKAYTKTVDEGKFR